MEAKDLRIGNWIKRPNYKNPYQVNKSSFIGWKMNYYKPIELTEEWLLKLGFKSDPYHDLYYANKPDGFFNIDINKTRGRLELHYKHIELKYVHQLQNLFFALTGEELTLK
jgi:hypothetical protein